MLELKEYWEGLTGMGKAKFIVKVILVILATLFSVFNWQSVELHLIFTKVFLPQTVLIVISMTVGLIISSIFDYRRFKKKDLEIKSLKEKLEKEAKQVSESGEPN